MEKVKKRVDLRVYGQVQGVLYRVTAEYMAKKFGITGYVKNTWRGTVEIVVEGEEAALNKFIEWAKVGTPQSRVEKIDVEWSDATGEFGGFDIK